LVGFQASALDLGIDERHRHVTESLRDVGGRERRVVVGVVAHG
jgi:hypothetical protein